VESYLKNIKYFCVSENNFFLVGNLSENQPKIFLYL
jgi:hypothetical protein